MKLYRRKMREGRGSFLFFAIDPRRRGLPGERRGKQPGLQDRGWPLGQVARWGNRDSVGRPGAFRVAVVEVANDAANLTCLRATRLCPARLCLCSPQPATVA